MGTREVEEVVHVMMSDRELRLMNIIEVVFLTPIHILRTYYVMKNIGEKARCLLRRINKKYFCIYGKRTYLK